MTIIKKGYLYKLPRSSMIKHWSKRWVILHSSSREGNLRMEYYDTEAQATREISQRIIPMEGCHALSQISAIKSKKYVFDFTTKLGRLVFATETQEELDDWMKSIKTAVQFDLDVRKRQKIGTTLPDQSSTMSAGSVTVENVVYESTQSGKYEVEIEPNETSERLQLAGQYILVIASDGVKLVKPDSGVEVTDWDYKYLKKYGKSTGKFNLETGRASKTGQGRLVFITTQGQQIFSQIHGNIQYLGSKKKARAESQRSKSLHNPSPSETTTSQPKVAHEAPARFNPNAEYAVVDKSKKKKRGGSISSHGKPEGSIATTTGIKAGTFRKISDDTPVGNNVYDTPMVQSVPTQQPIAEIQEPAQASAQHSGKQDAKIFDRDYDVPISPSSGAGISPTSLSPSSGMPTSASFASNDLGQFSDDPFSNSGNVVSSPLGNTDQDYDDVPPEPERDYFNASAFPASYSASHGTTTTTAFSFSDDDDDTVFNPLVDVEDFGKYLETGGNDDVWADLINPKFN